jgi:solute carrier family 12 (potassium/chloride transporter), member 4/6
MQSLTGTPRLLVAITNDDILLFLHYFNVSNGAEPYVATLFTAFMCIACAVIGNLDLITHIAQCFFFYCMLV